MDAQNIGSLHMLHRLLQAYDSLQKMSWTSSCTALLLRLLCLLCLLCFQRLAQLPDFCPCVTLPVPGAAKGRQMRWQQVRPRTELEDRGAPGLANMLTSAPTAALPAPRALPLASKQTSPPILSSLQPCSDLTTWTLPSQPHHPKPPVTTCLWLSASRLSSCAILDR